MEHIFGDNIDENVRRKFAHVAAEHEQVTKYPAPLMHRLEAVNYIEVRRTFIKVKLTKPCLRKLFTRERTLYQDHKMWQKSAVKAEQTI